MDSSVDYFKQELEDILHQVPPDYYQRGVDRNILQRLWHTGKLKAVLNLIDRKPKKILDVGCASGWFLSRIGLRYPKAKLNGLDAYKRAIEYGKRHYHHITFLHADAHTIPFPNKSFDLIICTEVLEHIVDPEKVLAEIKRLLTKDGRAIIEMDSGNFLFRFAWHWWTNMRNGVWKDAHLHVFNADKLEGLIKKSGFLIAEKKVFNATMAVAFRIEKK